MKLKIEAVELRQVAMPLQAPFETSFGVEQNRQCVIVKIQAEGLQAWGECVAGEFPGYSYETTQTAWSILSDYLIPLVLGGEANGPAEFGRLADRISGHPMAKAGIEMALWDLAGKAQKMPLADLLGGERTTVPVGVSVGIQPDGHKLLETVEGYLSQGYRRIKLKIKPGWDLQPVQHVRQRYPDLALQVDANAAYTSDAPEHLAELDGSGLLMIEQPFAAQDLIGHVRLSERISTPVCLDESVGSALEARQALELGACQLVNIKAGRVGGLNEATAIHDACIAQDAPVWCGGMLETGIGRAANLALAALPGFTLPGDISASERYYAEDLAWPRFTLNPDSTIDVPQGDGLGIEIDLDTLERFTLRRELFYP